MENFDFQDALKSEKFILNIFGLCPNQNRRLLSWTTFRTVLSLAMTINLTISILFVIDLSNMSTFMETAVFLVTQLGFIGKLIQFFNKKSQLYLIEEYLSMPSFYRYSFSRLKHIKADLKGTYTIAKYFRMFTVIYIIIAIAFPLSQRHDYVLPYNSWQPYSIRKPFNYYMTFILQILALITTAFTNSSFDVVYYIALSISCCQLDILMDHLLSVDYRKTSNTLQNELIVDINHHYQIVQFVKIVDNMYSNIVFIQCTASVLVICFVGFQLVVVASIASVEFVWGSSYFACMFIQIFFYCWYGHKVMIKSMEVGEACYSTNWYHADLVVRKLLFILMERTKRPFIFSAGFFQVSLTTLMAILRSSYSYMAGLQQLYGKTEGH